jgi:hypothetical protein
MVLNIGLSVSLDYMKDWKGIQEKAGDINSMKAYIAHDEPSC